eukprot:2135472-Rhodomonas_salina.2
MHDQVSDSSPLAAARWQAEFCCRKVIMFGDSASRSGKSGTFVPGKDRHKFGRCKLRDTCTRNL